MLARGKRFAAVRLPRAERAHRSTRTISSRPSTTILRSRASVKSTARASSLMLHLIRPGIQVPKRFRSSSSRATALQPMPSIRCSKMSSIWMEDPTSISPGNLIQILKALRQWLIYCRVQVSLAPTWSSKRRD